MTIKVTKIENLLERIEHLSSSVLSQLDTLSKNLQEHLGSVNGLRLPTQTFIEGVIELSEVYNSPIECWVISHTGNVAGYALLYRDRHPVLASLIIADRYRGIGMGTTLVSAIRENIPDQTLKVLVLKKDRQTVQFYKDNGAFVDYDHLSKHTYLMLFPPLANKGTPYVLSGESKMDRPDKVMG